MIDKQVDQLTAAEKLRQKEGLELIPSENYCSAEVLSALGSVWTDKYSEGYPDKRYYAGNQFVDRLEILAQNRAKKLFRVPHVNVQPYSGSPANLAVCTAVCKPGDTVLGLNLPDGGHLTHGWKSSATGIFFKGIGYHVRPDGKIDLGEALRLAREHRPKLIWVGGTAYPFKYPFKEFAEIAEETGACLAADIAHVAGLVIGGMHPSPAGFAHIITTTTHKTLRGPRGAIIMVTHKGIAFDPELPAKIDRAVFPGLQGGPHDNQIAATAIALSEAGTASFKKYARQTVRNAQMLAAELARYRLDLVGGKTENHLILLNLLPVFGPGGGIFGQEVLEAAGMTTNKNTIPREPASPFYPSGLRIGTPALTSRGMKERDMKKVARWIAESLATVAGTKLPDGREEKIKALTDFRKKIARDPDVSRIRRAVRQFAIKFPVPGVK